MKNKGYLQTPSAFLFWVFFIHFISFFIALSDADNAFAVSRARKKTADTPSCLTRIASFFQPVENLADDLLSVEERRRLDFANQIIRRNRIRKDKDCSHKIIKLRLDPLEWEKYKVLQEEIAKLIPDESQRPTIDLTIGYDERDRTHVNYLNIPLKHRSIGIAGGVGPLADATLLEKVMNELNQGPRTDWYRFNINLFSCPPPRTAGKGIRKLLYGNKIVTYGKRMLGFARRGHDKYYLASNTAHLNISKFKAMVPTKKSKGKTQSEVINLVDHVADQSVTPVKMTTETIHVDDSLLYPVSAISAVIDVIREKPKVLILGTMQAYENDLYPNYLKRRSLDEHLGNESPHLTPEDSSFHKVTNNERAQELQNLIDRAKQGEDPATIGNELVRFIVQEIQIIKNTKRDASVNRLILGCTELPMILEQPSAGGGITFLQQINFELARLNLGQVEFINSEEKFSEKITHDFKAITRN